MPGGRRDRRPRSGAFAIVLSCALVACGGESGGGRGGEASGGGEGDDPAATTAPATACPGEPLRFTSIVSLTGPLVVPSVAAESQDGLTAALRAVNRECALGRPIDVVVCDDKGDPNEATRCGRQAASDGSLALLGSSGAFDTGTSAAGLPGILTAGGTLFDLTDGRSFSATSGLTLVVGGASAAVAAGAEDSLLVAIDSGPTRTFVEMSQQIAENLGLPMDALFIPAGTTDYAPIAAQIAERDPGSIGLVLPSVVPLMNALEAEGITPHDVPIMTAITIFSPEVVAELGPKADGVYLLSQYVPPSDQDNEGVQQMLQELADAGIDVDPGELSPTLTNSWANVHILVDILRDLAPEQIETLDSDTLVAAVEAAGPTSRPEMASFDFGTNAFPDIPSLSGLRLFSREAMVVRVEDGGYVAVSPFGDATQPFDLDL